MALLLSMPVSDNIFHQLWLGTNKKWRIDFQVFDVRYWLGSWYWASGAKLYVESALSTRPRSQTPATAKSTWLGRIHLPFNAIQIPHFFFSQLSPASQPHILLLFHIPSKRGESAVLSIHLLLSRVYKYTYPSPLPTHCWVSPQTASHYSVGQRNCQFLETYPRRSFALPLTYNLLVVSQKQTTYSFLALGALARQDAAQYYHRDHHHCAFRPTRHCRICHLCSPASHFVLLQREEGGGWRECRWRVTSPRNSILLSIGWSSKVNLSQLRYRYIADHPPPKKTWHPLWFFSAFVFFLATTMMSRYTSFYTDLEFWWHLALFLYNAEPAGPYIHACMLWILIVRSWCFCLIVFLGVSFFFFDVPSDEALIWICAAIDTMIYDFCNDQCMHLPVGLKTKTKHVGNKSKMKCWVMSTLINRESVWD